MREVSAGREAPQPTDPLQALLGGLDLVPLGDGRFEGRSVEPTRPRMFGGELLAQTLVAASRTVRGRVAHALHAHFLAPGDPAVAIEYSVRRVRDGRRFALRQVSAAQRGRDILLATVSFATATADPFAHQQETMPDVEGP